MTLDPSAGRRWRIPSVRVVWAIPALLALLAAVVLFAETRRYELPGHDSYPVIATARVQSWGDLAGLWTEELMEGRYPGRFYRPVFGATIAADHALWGLRPAGYQATGALLFGICGVAVFLFARRLLERHAFAGPLVAMLAFLLHPAHFEVVPVPPRRPEMLCALFMMLALTAQLSPRVMARARPAVLPAVLGLTAMLSKETALLMPGLVLVAVALYSDRRGAVARLLHGTSAAGPHLGALAVVLLVRLAVLGGVGGHGAAALDPRYLPGAVWDVITLVIAPQPVMRATALPLLWGALLVTAGAATFALLRRGDAVDDRPRRPWLRASALAGVWLIGLSAVYMVSGRLEPWYLMLPNVGWCVVAAVVTDMTLSAFAAPSTRARVAAALAAAALLALLAWQARYSPFVHRYDEYRRAAAASVEFRDELARRVLGAERGAVIQAPPVPSWVRVTAGRPTLFGVAVLTDYSVQAWADLALPDRNVRVVRAREAGGASPGETRVVLVEPRRGFEAPLPPRTGQP